MGLPRVWARRAIRRQCARNARWHLWTCVHVCGALSCVWVGEPGNVRSSLSCGWAVQLGLVQRIKLPSLALA